MFAFYTLQLHNYLLNKIYFFTRNIVCESCFCETLFLIQSWRLCNNRRQSFSAIESLVEIKFSLYYNSIKACLLARKQLPSCQTSCFFVGIVYCEKSKCLISQTFSPISTSLVTTTIKQFIFLLSEM